MAIHRINHHYFGKPWRVSRLFLHVHSSVFNPVLHVSGAILEGFGLRFKPGSVKRRLSGVGSQPAIAIIRSCRQLKDRNWIAVVKPKQNRRLKLRERDRFFIENQNPWRCFGINVLHWSIFEVKKVLVWAGFGRFLFEMPLLTTPVAHPRSLVHCPSPFLPCYNRARVARATNIL